MVATGASRRVAKREEKEREEKEREGKKDGRGASWESLETGWRAKGKQWISSSHSLEISFAYFSVVKCIWKEFSILVSHDFLVCVCIFIHFSCPYSCLCRWIFTVSNLLNACTDIYFRSPKTRYLYGSTHPTVSQSSISGRYSIESLHLSNTVCWLQELSVRLMQEGDLFKGDGYEISGDNTRIIKSPNLPFRWEFLFACPSIDLISSFTILPNNIHRNNTNLKI